MKPETLETQHYLDPTTPAIAVEKFKVPDYEEMYDLLKWINLKYGDIEGVRVLTPLEGYILGRAREIIS
jgi:hypothetical protein